MSPVRDSWPLVREPWCGYESTCVFTATVTATGVGAKRYYHGSATVDAGERARLID